MKKILFIKTAFMSLTAIALLSSCLKDPRYVNFPSSVGTVELPAATAVGPSGGTVVSPSLAISSTPTAYNLQVNFAALKPLGSDITVKFTLDQAALTAYNTAAAAAGNQTYTLLPAADYSTSLSATIPANSNSGNLVINVNTSLIDPSQSYALPLTITDGGGQQISNWKTVLLNIQVKNKYDGVYTVTGSASSTFNAGYSGFYPVTVSLVTTGANSVAYYDNSQSNFVHLFLTGGAKSSFGEYDPIFIFDPSTNKITSSVNYYGQPSPTRGRTSLLEPTGTNAYTTGTPGASGSVFKVKYSLLTGATKTITFDETFTYKGSR